MQDLDWNDLRYVLALARSGTLAGAARQLKVDATTVARRLRVAEAALGARLFDRLPRGALRPTEAGLVTCGHAETVETAVRTLAGSVQERDGTIVGRVRITAVPILVSRVLIPAAATLNERCPALELEFVSEPRNLDLMRHEADIALRFARPSADAGRAILARRIGRLSYGVYAAAGYALEDAHALPWIAYGDDMAALPQARWTVLAAEREGGRAPIMVSDAEAVVSAVRAGLGRAPLPRCAGDAEPGLRLIDGPEGLPEVPSREVWSLMHRDLRPLARIAAVGEWLSSVFDRP